MQGLPTEMLIFVNRWHGALRSNNGGPDQFLQRAKPFAVYHVSIIPGDVIRYHCSVRTAVYTWYTRYQVDYTTYIGFVPGTLYHGVRKCKDH